MSFTGQNHWLQGDFKCKTALDAFYSLHTYICLKCDLNERLMVDRWTLAIKTADTDALWSPSDRQRSGCIISPLEVGNLKYLFVCSLAHYWLFWSVLTVCEGDKVSVALGSGCSGHTPTGIWLEVWDGALEDQLWNTELILHRHEPSLCCLLKSLQDMFHTPF